MKVMDVTDIKDLTAAVKKMTNATKATGPKTEKGKLRSALNATRHGLAGRGLLLPGEDQVEYEARLDGIFTAMAPQDDAEAELVALISDDLWKLGRLGRIEKGITLGRIEELLALTGTAERADVIGTAINSLGVAVTMWKAAPTPTQRNSEYARRFGAMSEAVNLVEATVPSLPADLMELGQDLLANLHGTSDGEAIRAEDYQAVFDFARQVMTRLLDMGHAQDAAQDELRTAISGIALPDETELKKLARYRKMLEDSLQRRHAALEQLRKLNAGRVADVVKSREYRVRLRVVA